MFFAVYWDEIKQKRTFETVPLNEVVEHQKQTASLSATMKAQIQPNREKGKFLFSLSPNDLVYVPNEIDIGNSEIVTISDLNLDCFYRMVSATGRQSFFIRCQVAKSIANKLEFSALNKMEKDINGTMIKSICWKLEVDRLGNVLSVNKGSS